MIDIIIAKPVLSQLPPPPPHEAEKPHVYINFSKYAIKLKEKSEVEENKHTTSTAAILTRKINSSQQVNKQQVQQNET